ncbi:MAG TPA: hypothetical protein RMH99_20830 [Sandaracinaceae bacterium LLY-WYZ-13_1]|nr:hypothetical protein [Sandaracinaceae bacterium LLY-WYZ-13_1]
MRRWAHLAPLVAVAATALIGCGASTPRESDIYHDPALRPGVVTAAASDSRLLARLAELEGADSVQIDGRRYEVEAAYAAASGRTCRSVLPAGASPRLACESEDGWVFVPQVLPVAIQPPGTEAPADERREPQRTAEPQRTGEHGATEAGDAEATP